MGLLVRKHFMIPPNHQKGVLGSNPVGSLLTAHRWPVPWNISTEWTLIMQFWRVCLSGFFLRARHWPSLTRDQAANSTASARLTQRQSESGLHRETQPALRRALTTVQRTLQSLDSTHTHSNTEQIVHTQTAANGKGSVYFRESVCWLRRASSDGATTHQWLNYKFFFVQIKDYKGKRTFGIESLWDYTIHQRWHTWLHRWIQIWSGFVLCTVMCDKCLLKWSREVLTGTVCFLGKSIAFFFFMKRLDYSTTSKPMDWRQRGRLLTQCSCVFKYSSMCDFCACGRDFGRWRFREAALSWCDNEGFFFSLFF